MFARFFWKATSELKIRILIWISVNLNPDMCRKSSVEMLASFKSFWRTSFWCFRSCIYIIRTTSVVSRLTRVQDWSRISFRTIDRYGPSRFLLNLSKKRSNAFKTFTVKLLVWPWDFCSLLYHRLLWRTDMGPIVKK